MRRVLDDFGRRRKTPELCAKEAEKRRREREKKRMERKEEKGEIGRENMSLSIRSS